MTVETDSWTALCQTVQSSGAKLLAGSGGSFERGDTDTLRFLSRILRNCLDAQVGAPDVDGPTMRKFLDEFTCHGMPNSDNVYRFSRIEPGRAYRLSGNARNRPFLISTGSGDTPDWQFCPIAEFSSEDLSFDVRGDFDIVFRPSPVATGELELAPEATILLVREYWADWDQDPGEFYLELIDTDDVPGVSCQDSAVVPQRFAQAAEQFIWTAEFWSAYAARWRGDTPNQFSPGAGRPDTVAQTYLQYRVGWVQLDPSQALVLEVDPPTSNSYWAIQLYSLWGLPLDPHIAPSSLNSAQVVADDDGKIRLVVSSRDPGVANWVDLRGYREAVIWYRVMSRADVGTPAGRVINIDDVNAELPGTHPVTADERRTILGRRRRAAALRHAR